MSASSECLPGSITATASVPAIASLPPPPERPTRSTPRSASTARTAAAPAATTRAPGSPSDAHGPRGPVRRRRQRGARRRDELGAGLPAVLRILGHRAPDDGVERGGHAGPPLARSRRLVLEVGVDRRHLRIPGEGHLAGQCLEQHAPEGVEVGTAIGLLARDALWCHVIDRADQLVAGRDAVRGRDVAGEPEVGEVDVLIGALDGDQHVARLDVAMDQAPRMGRVECVRELRHQVDRALRLHGTRAVQQRSEVGALDVAHRDVQVTVALAGLVDRHDAGVIDRRGESRLRQEARAEASILGQVRGQQLQRYLAPQTQVLGAVHHAHAAATEERLDAITPQMGSDAGSRHGAPALLAGARPAYARVSRAQAPEQLVG